MNNNIVIYKLFIIIYSLVIPTSLVVWLYRRETNEIGRTTRVRRRRLWHVGRGSGRQRESARTSALHDRDDRDHRNCGGQTRRPDDFTARVVRLQRRRPRTGDGHDVYRRSRGRAAEDVGRRLVAVHHRQHTGAVQVFGRIRHHGGRPQQCLHGGCGRRILQAAHKLRTLGRRRGRVRLRAFDRCQLFRWVRKICVDWCDDRLRTTCHRLDVYIGVAKCLDVLDVWYGSTIIRIIIFNEYIMLRNLNQKCNYFNFQEDII